MTKFEKILLTISIICFILWCILSADNSVAYYFLSIGFISLSVLFGSGFAHSKSNIFDNRTNINITINSKDKESKN